ncbi:MAG: nucleotidyltransferase domain-containing protein [Thermoguttaceae bacterium]
MKTTLPERSGHVAEQLAAITEIVKELMGDDLVRLILFGSFARGTWVNHHYVEDDIHYGYESDFDLLIVSEDRASATVDGEARLSNAIARRLRQQGLDRPSSTIIVEDIEHLNKDLRRGSYFFTDIKKEGVLLYDSGKHTLAEAGPLDPAEYQKYAREDFEHWFPSACGFMKMYAAAMEQGENNIAVFL